MTIDQIKQAMKYAEDYKWIDENLNILKPDCQRIPWEYLGTSPYYGFFLQQVIEGMNRELGIEAHIRYYRESKTWYIDLCIYGRYYDKDQYFKGETPDQAKEAAIIWVLENES